jgi:hypothetical protein
VEAPAAESNYHSVELTESYKGRWLANYEGETALTRTADIGADFRWEYNHPYRLRLTVTPDAIEGKVMELNGQLRRHIAYRFDPGKPAVTSGAPALDNAVFTAQFDDVRAEVADPIPGPPVAPVRTEFPAYSVPACEQVSGRRTGFFHTEKQNDTWWLIDPDGRGFYAVGTDHINYRGHWCQQLGYAPYGRNVAEKYGSEEKWADATAERLRDWGFNTLPAGHSQDLRYRSFAHIDWLGAGREFADMDNIVPRTTWTGFPNVFSPRWPRHCDALAKRICAPNRDDPWLIGYFLDNELQWFGGLDNWRNDYGLWSQTWMKPTDHSAKQAWLGLVRERCASIGDYNRAWGTTFASFEALAASTEPVPPPSDEARAMARDFVRLVADRYFAETSAAIRRHDPNHLVLGCRFAGWAPADIWDIAGKYCDVVSFNTYPRIDVERGVPRSLVGEFQGFYELAQKPLMITEWSFPALDSGLPCKHGAGMRVATQHQKAACYRAFQSTLFALPFFVGSDYFMYIDEPALGISDTFPEDSNYGLVNEKDEAWPELTATAAEVNPTVCELHSSGRLTHVYDPKPVAWTAPLPPERPGSPALPPTIRAGALELKPAEGRDAWRMLYAGRPLGTFGPMIHQRVPRDLWVSPEDGAVTAVREDADFLVVDMTFSHGGGGQAMTVFDAQAGARVPQADAPGAFKADWRFWIPRNGSGWFGAQSLRVENADARPWELASLFHFVRPALGGSEEGDEEGSLNVPNFYLRLGAWEDAQAGLGVAVFSPDDRIGIGYWKAEDGFHSDCRQSVNVELAPGQAYEEAGPMAVHFGYELTGENALLERLEEVGREVQRCIR